MHLRVWATNGAADEAGDRVESNCSGTFRAGKVSRARAVCTSAALFVRGVCGVVGRDEAD